MNQELKEAIISICQRYPGIVRPGHIAFYEFEKAPLKISLYKNGHLGDFSLGLTVEKNGVTIYEAGASICFSEILAYYLGGFGMTRMQRDLWDIYMVVYKQDDKFNRDDMQPKRNKDALKALSEIRKNFSFVYVDKTR